MNPDFQRLMNEATRLTRAGNLTAATAVVQAALCGQAVAAPPDGDVIDVEARVVPDAGHAAAQGVPTAAVLTAPDRAARMDARSEREAAASSVGARPERRTSSSGTDHRTAHRASTPDALMRGYLGKLPGIDFAKMGMPLSGAPPDLPTPMKMSMQMPVSMPMNMQMPGSAFPAGLRGIRDPDAPGAERFMSGSHTEGTDHREYKLYVPSAAGQRPLPLVVMLHGCTQDPDDFAAGTAMNQAAEEQGFFVLYPAQSQSMNPQRCWNWFKHTHQSRDRGEPALLAGMTRDVMARHAIDPDRVYVAGLSAGAAMAAILGEAYPDIYVAVGVHSGLAAGAASDLPSALAAMRGDRGTGHTATAASGVPTIVFHGDADATVHPANGEQVIAASVGSTVQANVERLPNPTGHATTRRVYRTADGQVVAEHWLVHGATHAWSGGDARGSYTDGRGPDATAEMLRFFFERSRGVGH